MFINIVCSTLGFSFLIPRGNEHLLFLQRLNYAVDSNDLVSSVLLVAHMSASLPKSPSKRFSPLHISCRNGNATLTQFLLWNDYDPNMRDEHGFTPLDVARDCNASDCVQVLLQNGAIEAGKSDSLSSRSGRTSLGGGGLFSNGKKSPCGKNSSATLEILPASVI